MKYICYMGYQILEHVVSKLRMKFIHTTLKISSKMSISFINANLLMNLINIFVE